MLHVCTILYLDQTLLIKHACILMEMLQNGFYLYFYSFMKEETTTQYLHFCKRMYMAYWKCISTRSTKAELLGLK